MTSAKLQPHDDANLMQDSVLLSLLIVSIFTRFVMSLFFTSSSAAISKKNGWISVSMELEPVNN